MHKNKDGYILINIKKDGKWKIWREHRYIWTQHYGAIPPNMTIDHINGKKDDNRIENLQLLSHKENSQRNDFGGIRRVGNRYEARRTFNSKRYSSCHGTLGGAYMANRVIFL